MTFANLYFIAGLTFPAGVVFWMLARKVLFWEPLALTGAALICAGLVHGGAYASQGKNDIQLLHGRVNSAEFIPKWQEWYEEAIYRTEFYTVTVRNSDGKGSHSETRTRQVFDHWEARTRWHSDSWGESDTFATIDIDGGRYRSILGEFGREEGRHSPRSTMEHNSRQIGGDENVYTAVNKNGALYPVHITDRYTNRIILNPTLFDFTEPANYKAPAEFPLPTSRFDCRQALGRQGWPNRALERACSVLGPAKHVNLMTVGMDGGVNESINLEAHWRGGKRNDVVICFGGPAAHPTWVRCFGWSESLLVFRNLESMLLREGFTTDTLDKTMAEIRAGYTIKDWHAFDYLPLRVSWWWAVLLIALVSGTVTGWWFMIARDRYAKPQTPLDILSIYATVWCEKNFVSNEDIARRNRK